MADNYVERVTARLHRELPGCDHDLLRLYALLALVKGERTTLEDVHDAWALWRTATDRRHRSIVPFADLAPEVRELDRGYAEAIRRVAALPAGH